MIQNVWAICRDPNIYPDPETFNPERFLKDGKINPQVFNPEDRVFGAGRRQETLFTFPLIMNNRSCEPR